MATATNKPAASKPKATTAKAEPVKTEEPKTPDTAPTDVADDNKPAERTGVDNTVTEDSSVPEAEGQTAVDSAGEIALPDPRELDRKAAEDAAKQGDAVDEKAKAEEDSVRAEIDQHAQAVKDNPVRPEEEIPQAYIVGGEVPVNAPGTEGLARE